MRIGPLALAFLLAQPASAAGVTSAPADRFPELAASYAVVVNDQLLWAKDIDVARPPASLAKLLTAIELLENGWDARALATVSVSAARVAGSRAGLRPGETLTLDDLLTAMLVRSANDACVALVEYSAGGLPQFTYRLNRRARLLGMTQSNFVHPCGLDARGQRTTVRDLLILAKAAVERPEILRRGGALRAEIATQRGRRIELSSTNMLLAMDMGVIGLKTGYTSRAGDCLIALAERDGRRALVVLLNASNRWWGASAAIEQAFLQTGGPPPL